MEYKVEIPDPSKRVLEVSVPASVVQQEIDRLSNYYSKRTRLNGFRAGRVPPQLIKAKQFSRLQKEAIDRVVNDTYKKALEETKLSPINYAKIEKISFEPHTKLSFRASFEVIPDIRIKQYKNLHCVKKIRDVTEARVDKELERLRESSPVLKPVERPIREPDAVVIDLKIYQGQELIHETTGSTVFVKGLLKEVREKIVGKAPGDKVRLNQDGKTTYISIREVKEPLYPEIDDNFAKDLGFESLRSLKDKIREELKKAEELRSERELEEEIVHHLIDENPFDPPLSLVEAQLDQISTESESGENYSKNSRDRTRAIYLVKRRIILDKIASLENIVVSEKELQEEIDEIAKREAIPAVRLRTQLEKDGRINILKNRIKYDKVLKFLVNNASVKMKKVKE